MNFLFGIPAITFASGAYIKSVADTVNQSAVKRQRILDARQAVQDRNKEGLDQLAIDDAQAKLTKQMDASREAITILQEEQVLKHLKYERAAIARAATIIQKHVKLVNELKVVVKAYSDKQVPLPANILALAEQYKSDLTIKEAQSTLAGVKPSEVKAAMSGSTTFSDEEVAKAKSEFLGNHIKQDLPVL